MYYVMLTFRSGAIGVSSEISRHRTRAAAYRAMKAAQKRFPRDQIDVVDESGADVIFAFTKKNGRWKVIG